MSVKSESIQSKKDSGQDERLKKISPLRVLLNRPELGALGGSILVFIFFGIVAGDTGMFSAYGTLNFLDVSANLGIIAIAAAMLMIGGEFDLSIGSMIGFAGICIAIAMQIPAKPIIDPIDKSNSPPIINIAAAIAIIPKLAETSKKFNVP